jgi:DNA-binding HxlR family transcriptional regulator
MEAIDKKCPRSAASDKECERYMIAMRDALDILSGKWKLPIIFALTFKKYRFKELVRAVGISPKMLSKELKDLEINQLIQRTVWDTAPVTVEYSITPYGRTLKDVLGALGKWGVQHRRRIMSKERPATA